MMKQLIIVIVFTIGLLPLQAQNYPAEVNWLNSINPQNPANSRFWVTTSQSVYPVAVGSAATLLATGYLKKNKALQNSGWHITGALLVNAVATQGLKTIVNRDRPFITYPGIINGYNTTETNQSFPSGHTSTAFAFATAISMENKKWYIVAPAFLYAGSIGYSRMYLGVHYPSDVFAGAAVGVASAYLNTWLQKKLFKK